MKGEMNGYIEGTGPKTNRELVSETCGRVLDEEITHLQ